MIPYPWGERVIWCALLTVGIACVVAETIRWRRAGGTVRAWQVRVALVALACAAIYFARRW